MAKYVPDVKTQRWVILSPLRTKRPEDVSADKTSQPVCPFCEGSEKSTPPEVYRLGKGEPNAPGWTVRVVPNKFPITDIHEVIIHNPDHVLELQHLPHEAASALLTAYRNRFKAHEHDGHVLIFSNAGKHAGASLTHPHTQLVVIPRQITLDTLVRERITNIIEEIPGFVSYCPDFSQWPYEVWITPRTEGKKFSEVTDDDIPVLASFFQKTLLKIERVTHSDAVRRFYPDESFQYNFYVYHGESWYIRIIPRFIHRAGFELGTGLNVNLVDPMDASEALKKI